MKMQKFISPIRKAIEDYHMIEEGDGVAVGVSGGKDSLALLVALAELKKYYPKSFDLCAITLDMGFEGGDWSEIQKLCDEIHVPYHIVKTDIKQVVFDIRKESNPCSLCAKMRRGALNDAALLHNCRKVALGHHFDDVVETYFLSLFYEGRINCFSPVTYLSRKEVFLIRPLIYTHEKEVVGFIRSENISVVKSGCPANGNTKREEIKQVIRNLDFEHKGLKSRVFTAIKDSDIPGWKARKL